MSATEDGSTAPAHLQQLLSGRVGPRLGSRRHRVSAVDLAATSASPWPRLGADGHQAKTEISPECRPRVRISMTEPVQVAARGEHRSRTGAIPRGHRPRARLGERRGRQLRDRGKPRCSPPKPPDWSGPVSGWLAIKGIRLTVQPEPKLDQAGRQTKRKKAFAQAEGGDDRREGTYARRRSLGRAALIEVRRRANVVEVGANDPVDGVGVVVTWIERSPAGLKEITETRSSPATDTKQYFPSSLECDQYGTRPTLTRALQPNGLPRHDRRVAGHRSRHAELRAAWGSSPARGGPSRASSPVARGPRRQR